jgi:hypothetical protein
VDESGRIRAVEQVLIRRFGQQLPVQVIQAEVDQARQELDQARIRAYVPVLVQRRANEALNRHLRRTDT